MEYKKTSNNILLSDLTQSELFGIIKSQIECELIFTQNDSPIYSLKLYSRTIKGNQQVIEIETITKAKEIVNYPTLLKYVKEGYELGILNVVIKKKLFKEKEPLIAIIDTIRQEIIESCIYVDYDKKIGLFSVINKDLSNGFSDKLYFYEDNNSILLFGKEGPKLVYNEKFSSVEDILCN